MNKIELNKEKCNDCEFKTFCNPEIKRSECCNIGNNHLEEARICLESGKIFCEACATTKKEI